MMELGWHGIKLINNNNKLNKMKTKASQLKNNLKRIANKANHRVIMKMKMIQVAEVVMKNNP
jgi:hypothetical protein